MLKEVFSGDSFVTQTVIYPSGIPMLAMIIFKLFLSGFVGFKLVWVFFNVFVFTDSQVIVWGICRALQPARKGP